ncbi:MAG: hypothetical protein HY063_11700 [Bacteroidetes bacterium]|nr:hypothetical protein [Bacteroidota bacterium]
MKTQTSYLYKCLGIFLALACIFPLGISYFLGNFIGFMDWPLDWAYKDRIGSILFPISYLIISFIISFKWKSLEHTNPPKAEIFKNIIINIIRFTSAYIMFFYAVVKLTHKQMDVSYYYLDAPMREANPWALMSYFYGRSNWQILIISLMELIPSCLLMFRKTMLLGAILMIPVAGNVVMINAFNDFQYATLLTSVLIFIMTIYIIISYPDKLKIIWNILSEKTSAIDSNQFTNKLFKAGKILFWICVIYPLATRIYHKTKINMNKDKKLSCGIFQITELKTNSVLQNLDVTNYNYWKKLYIESDDWNTLKDKNNVEANATGLLYRENAANDSVKINPIYQDSAKTNHINNFTGTYFYNDKDSSLLLKGLQGEDSIESIYKKLPIKDYSWWW